MTILFTHNNEDFEGFEGFATTSTSDISCRLRRSGLIFQGVGHCCGGVIIQRNMNRENFNAKCVHVWQST